MKLFCKIFGHWKKYQALVGYQLVTCRMCGEVISLKTWKQIAIEFGEAIKKSNEMANASIIQHGGWTRKTGKFI